MHTSQRNINHSHEFYAYLADKLPDSSKLNTNNYTTNITNGFI